jgi:hypothetical protein
VSVEKVENAIFYVVQMVLLCRFTTSMLISLSCVQRELNNNYVDVALFYVLHVIFR